MLETMYTARSDCPMLALFRQVRFGTIHPSILTFVQKTEPSFRRNLAMPASADPEDTARNLCPPGFSRPSSSIFIDFNLFTKFFKLKYVKFFIY